mgnify:FL=1
MSTHCKNGREAITHYKVLERFGDYTISNVSLKPDEPIRSVSIWRASVIL